MIYKINFVFPRRKLVSLRLFSKIETHFYRDLGSFRIKLWRLLLTVSAALLLPLVRFTTASLNLWTRTPLFSAICNAWSIPLTWRLYKEEWVSQELQPGCYLWGISWSSIRKIIPDTSHGIQSDFFILFKLEIRPRERISLLITWLTLSEHCIYRLHLSGTDWWFMHWLVNLWSASRLRISSRLLNSAEYRASFLQIRGFEFIRLDLQHTRRIVRCRGICKSVFQISILRDLDNWHILSNLWWNLVILQTNLQVS